MSGEDNKCIYCGFGEQVATKPLISIVIPVKNGDKYIYDCLSSVLSSLGQIRDFEVIVSDNHSTDQTINEIQRISDPRVRIVKPGKELTIGENWTFGSEQAKGTYFKLVGADDLLVRNSIQSEIQQLQSASSAVAVVSRRKIIGPRGETLIKSRGYGRLSSLENGSDAIIRTWNSGTNLFGDPSAILFKNQIVQVNLPWVSNRYPYVVDLSLYLKVFSNEQFLVSGNLVSEFRIHPNSVTGSTYVGHAKQYLTLYKENTDDKLFQKLRVFFACYSIQTLKLIFLMAVNARGWLTRLFSKN